MTENLFYLLIKKKAIFLTCTNLVWFRAGALCTADF